MSVGHVTKTYFVSDGEKIKIGRAVNLRVRLRQLQIEYPHRLRFLGVLMDNRETEMHRRFARYRVRCEWFRPVKPLLNFIDANCVKPRGAMAAERREMGRRASVQPFTFPWLTIPQAARYLSVTKEKIRSMINSGDLPAETIGKRSVRIREANLNSIKYGYPAPIRTQFPPGATPYEREQPRNRRAA
jgi:excisionase family DNA binding protein